MPPVTSRTRQLERVPKAIWAMMIMHNDTNLQPVYERSSKKGGAWSVPPAKPKKLKQPFNTRVSISQMNIDFEQMYPRVSGWNLNLYEIMIDLLGIGAQVEPSEQYKGHETHHRDVEVGCLNITSWSEDLIVEVVASTISLPVISLSKSLINIIPSG